MVQAASFAVRSLAVAYAQRVALAWLVVCWGQVLLGRLKLVLRRLLVRVLVRVQHRLRLLLLRLI